MESAKLIISDSAAKTIAEIQATCDSQSSGKCFSFVALLVEYFDATEISLILRAAKKSNILK